MIIACATDRNYTELAGVLVSSIVLNGGVPDARIVVFDVGLAGSDRTNIQKCAHGRHVEFVRFSPPDIELIARTRRTKSCSRATYCRLLLPDMLSGAERLLYLDSDMVVRESLRPLAEIDLGDHAVGAVLDNVGGEQLAHRNIRINRAPESPYFNAGLLLVDVEKWKQREIGKRSLDLVTTRSMEFLDQDALNIVLERDFLPLDKKWNVIADSAEPGSPPAGAEICIVHYCASKKPNMRAFRHPLKSIFLEQRQHTPWRDRVLISDFQRRLRRFMMRQAVRLDALKRTLRDLLASNGNLRQ